MNYDKLIQSDFSNKTYWVVATEAAIGAGRRISTRGLRRRTQLSRLPLKSTRERLGIIDVEKEIESCDWTYTAMRGKRAKGPSRSQAVINTPSKRKSNNTSSKK